MKKTMTVLAIALTVGVLGYQIADAGPGRWGGGFGPGYCNGYGTDASATSQEWQTFQDETADLRKQLFEKRNEYFSMMNGENVDKEAAQALWSDIFDLQKQIREKAEAAGIDPQEGFGPRGGRRGYAWNGPRGGYFCNGPYSGGPAPGYGPGSCWNR